MSLSYMKRIATYLGGEGGFYVSRPGGGAPAAHKVSHQAAGSDELSLTGMAGLLVTAQTPAAHTQAYSTLTSVPSTFAPSVHATSHQNAGADEIATATAAANAIPKAGAGATLAAGWFPTGLGAMKQLYLNTVAGAAVTSWSVTTGLAGNTDLIYLIRFQLIEAQLNTVLRLTLNNDTGNNYGDSGIQNTNTTVTGTRNTAQANFPLAFVNAAGHSAHGWVWIYAKTGQVRHITLDVQEQVTGTTVTTVANRKGVYTETATEITRIDVVSSIASGIGIGSTLEIWALRAA